MWLPSLLTLHNINLLSTKCINCHRGIEFVWMVEFNYGHIRLRPLNLHCVLLCDTSHYSQIKLIELLINITKLTLSRWIPVDLQVFLHGNDGWSNCNLRRRIYRIAFGFSNQPTGLDSKPQFHDVTLEYLPSWIHVRYKLLTHIVLHALYFHTSACWLLCPFMLIRTWTSEWKRSRFAFEQRLIEQ